MFLSKASDGGVHADGGNLDEDALLSMTSPPDPSMWMAIRAQFLATAASNTELLAVISDMKRSAQRGGSSMEDPDEQPESPKSPAAKKSAFQPQMMSGAQAGANPLLLRKGSASMSMKQLSAKQTR